MWLRKIRVRNLKRLRDFTLDLLPKAGREKPLDPRMWTVLIGPNGTAKTTLLQAIALAAAGAYDAERLVRDTKASLFDKRQEKPVPGARRGRVTWPAVEIKADFAFGPTSRKTDWAHPMHSNAMQLSDPESRECLRSRLLIDPDSYVLGRASYHIPGEMKDATRGVRSAPKRAVDPLVDARQDGRALWFVAGYGVYRDLPKTSAATPPPDDAEISLNRLAPLFEPRALIGPNFASVFEESRYREFVKLLRNIVRGSPDLIPGLADIELRGRGGVRDAADFVEGHRLVQEVRGTRLKLPARWFSHGYQSSIAWISDLVGQIMLEASGTMKPEIMEGLVLIDEIDLYLHPAWQVGLVQALKSVFPRIQFIVTTHSPILLNAFRPEEVVRLDFNDAGDVLEVETHEDPRLMTGTEIYKDFFGVDELDATQMKQKLVQFLALATDPERSAPEDRQAHRILDELTAEGIEPGVTLTPRAVRRGGHKG